MTRIELLLPAMGEGIIEATINKWLVTEGTVVKEDDSLVEVATDKVDSEIPSPVNGRLVTVVVKEGNIARIGDVIGIIETESDLQADNTEKVEQEVSQTRRTIEALKNETKEINDKSDILKSRTPSGKYLSPLVKSIALKEGISFTDLDKLTGTGMDGRITKDDILAFVRKRSPDQSYTPDNVKVAKDVKKDIVFTENTEKINTEDEIVPMDRVRKLIAEHMVNSKRTSPHVTSFIDADVTKLITWRARVKDDFLKNRGVKLTLTPIFIDAAAKALQEFPLINVSVEGSNIIRRKNINIGMATALPDGNLMVPVIKNADEKSLFGLARSVNDLAERARNNKLKPDEITGGTFTITNFGTYNNLAGTPIINQPQAAILGTGAVRKTPVVIETEEGDVIAIRQIMILSLSYDHRVIDGALAGRFLQRVKSILENYSQENL